MDLVAVYAPAPSPTRSTSPRPRSDAGLGDVPLVVGVGGAGPETVPRSRRGCSSRGDPGRRRPGAASPRPSGAGRRRPAAAPCAPAAPAPAAAALRAAGPLGRGRRQGAARRARHPHPAGGACDDRADAHAALAELGGPVAVKLLDATVLHKTEIGGVHLGVRTADELDAALDALDAAGPAASWSRRWPRPASTCARRPPRPVFGPIVLLGLGGTAAEALADVTIRLAPLTAGRGRRRCPTTWPAAPCSTAGAAGPCWTAPQLGAGRSRRSATCSAATPHLAEIEINPLRLTADGLVALDAVIVTTDRGDRPCPARSAERHRPLARGRTPSATSRRATGTGQPLGDLLRAAADRTSRTRSRWSTATLRLTYRELADRADAAAARLLDLGLRPDDRHRRAAAQRLGVRRAHPGLPARRRSSR